MPKTDYYESEEIQAIYQKMIENEHGAITDVLSLLPAIPLPHMEFELHVSDYYIPKSVTELSLWTSINYKGEQTRIPCMLQMYVSELDYPARIRMSGIASPVSMHITAESIKDIETYIDQYIRTYTENTIIPLTTYDCKFSIQNYYDAHKYVEKATKLDWKFKPSVGFMHHPKKHKLINSIKFLKTWPHFLDVATNNGCMEIGLTSKQQQEMKEICQVKK